MYNIYKTEILTDLDEKLIRQWKELWMKAENSNIFNSYEWFSAFSEIDKNKKYEFHVCYRNNKLVGILPLQQYRCFGVKIYGTVCKERLGDTAFLMEKYDKELFKHFFEGIIKRKNIYIQKIDDKATKMLHEIYPQFFFSLISVNPIVNLRSNFSATSSTTIQKIEKIIKKNPDIFRFEMKNSDLEKHMKILLALHDKSSKKERDMDIFQDEQNKAYYTAMAKKCSKFVRISFLYFNDKPIAYEYGFRYRGYYLGEQIAFHNNYRKYAPGKLMVYFLIKHLKKNNMSILDQGGGISSYKMSFTHNYRLLYNLYYSRNIIVTLWWKLINKARRIRQTLCPKKYTRDHEFLFKTL